MAKKSRIQHGKLEKALNARNGASVRKGTRTALKWVRIWRSQILRKHPWGEWRRGVLRSLAWWQLPWRVLHCHTKNGQSFWQRNPSLVSCGSPRERLKIFHYRSRYPIQVVINTNKQRKSQKSINSVSLTYKHTRSHVSSLTVFIKPDLTCPTPYHSFADRFRWPELSSRRPQASYWPSGPFCDQLLFFPSFLPPFRLSRYSYHKFRFSPGLATIFRSIYRNPATPTLPKPTFRIHSKNVTHRARTFPIGGQYRSRP